MTSPVCGPREIRFSLDNTVVEAGSPNSAHTINSHNTIFYNNGGCSSDTATGKMKIVSWLQKQSTDYKKTHDEVYSSRIPGTGMQFFDSEEYGEWVRGDRKNLECIGKPGAGKTSMASAIVEHLTGTFECTTPQPTSNQNIVLCAYFRHTTQRYQTQSLVFANLLSQILLRTQAEPSKDVLALYNEFGLHRDAVPRLDKTIAVLTSEIAGYKRVYIVIDALDEFSLLDESLAASLVKHLEELGARLLITSRFPAGFTVGTFSSMTVYANAEDITTFVRGRSTGRLARFFKTHPDLEPEITQEICKKCDGMFIIARLLIDALSGLLTVHAIRKTLKELPPGLDATYKLAMERIDSQNDALKTLARRAFAWVRFAQRPLTLPQLQHALAIEPGVEEICDVVHEDDIFLACAGLIELSAGNVNGYQAEPTIQFIHFSAMEFFKKYSDLYFPNAERDITEDCLRYLTITTLTLPRESPIEETEKHPKDIHELEAHWKTYALSSYAANYWGTHAYNIEEKFDFSLVSAAYEHPKSPFIAIPKYNEFQPPALMQPKHYQLFYCARSNLPLLLGYLQQDIDISSDMRDAVDCDMQHIAARCGSYAVLEILVKNGVDVNSLSGDHRTPLLNAVESGHYDTVKFLLENGANPNILDNDYISALWHASSHGRTEIIKLLLKHKVDLNVPGQSKSQFITAHPFRVPCNIQIMKMLLEYGVNPNIGDIVPIIGDLMTPLMDAATHGRYDAVELLLDNGADPNLFGRRSETALTYAARSGEARVASILIQRGADLDDPDRNQRTPLSYAADRRCSKYHAKPKGHHGKVDVVELLLRLGADPNTHSSNGMTPLSYAVNSGCLRTTSLLLAHGAHPDAAPNCLVETPLIIASREGHYEVVKALLAAGADLALAPQTDKRTALSYAAGLGCVQCDRSPNSTSGWPDIVRLLVENGADIEACDKEGRTPISYAAQAGNSEAVEALLCHGAMMDKADIHGRAPISYALSRNWISNPPYDRQLRAIAIVTSHIQHPHHIHPPRGLQPSDRPAHNDFREDLKQTVDQLANTVRIMLEHGGVDVNRVDKDGHTPLSRAESLRCLLESEASESALDVLNRMEGYRL